MLPVGKPKCKKLKAGRLEQQVPVLVGEVGYPRDSVAEVSYDVDGGGEQGNDPDQGGESPGPGGDGCEEAPGGVCGEEEERHHQGRRPQRLLREDCLEAGIDTGKTV